MDPEVNEKIEIIRQAHYYQGEIHEACFKVSDAYFNCRDEILSIQDQDFQISQAELEKIQESLDCLETIRTLGKTIEYEMANLNMAIYELANIVDSKHTIMF